MSTNIPTPTGAGIQSLNSQVIQNTQQQVEDVKPNFLMQFFPLLLLVFVFYFIIIRPQQKKTKETNQMLSNLKIGTKILTAGGIYGIVTDIENDLIKLEISKNVKIVVSKASIISIYKGDGI